MYVLVADAVRYLCGLLQYICLISRHACLILLLEAVDIVTSAALMLSKAHFSSHFPLCTYSPPAADDIQSTLLLSFPSVCAYSPPAADVAQNTFLISFSSVCACSERSRQRAAGRNTGGRVGNDQVSGYAHGTSSSASAVIGHFGDSEHGDALEQRVQHHGRRDWLLRCCHRCLERCSCRLEAEHGTVQQPMIEHGQPFMARRGIHYLK